MKEIALSGNSGLSLEQCLSFHQLIDDVLDEALKAIKARRADSACIDAFYNLVSKYLVKQDKDFYKGLRDWLSASNKSFSMVEFLEYDIKDLKIKLFVFYDRFLHVHHAGRYQAVLRDWHELADAVQVHLQVERKYLFPLLEAQEGLATKIASS